MTSEATKVQLESCHCCKMYDRPCLQSSSGDKKSTSSKLLKEDTNSKPETTWEPKETSHVYLDSLIPLSQLLMELQDHQVDCQTLKHGTCDIDLSGWEITCTDFVPRGRRQARFTTHTDTIMRIRTCSPVREFLKPKIGCRCPLCQPCFKCGEYGHFLRDCRSSIWKDPPNHISTPSGLNWTGQPSSIKSGSQLNKHLRQLENSCKWYRREKMGHVRCTTSKKNPIGMS